MPTSERPSKKEAFLALLREGWTSLHLDARRAGVLIPAHLQKEAHLVLQYGYDLPIPIPDLLIDDSGVKATLSFSQTPHTTFVPWSSIYVVACDDGRGILYAEDVPHDVSVVAAHGQEGDGQHAGLVDGHGEVPAPAAPPPVASPEKAARALRAVGNEEAFDPSAADPDGPHLATASDVMAAAANSAPASKKRKRPSLRLVK